MTQQAPGATGFLERVGAALDALGVREEGLLVAVSGGIDSVVLLDALAELSPARQLTLCVGTIDHQLRGAASVGDAEFVAQLAAARGLPMAHASVSPETLRANRSSRERPTRQESARQLRYAALRRMAAAHGAARIATAHHADDQGETVLLRLLRGCGPDALGGIPEVSPDGKLVRPLLGLSRDDIRAYAGARGLVWREDASNRDLGYARNRLRQRWLPGLAREFNPRLLRTLGHLAEAHRRDAEWIEEILAEEGARRFRREGDAFRVDRSGWEQLPTGLARRLAHRVWCQAGGARDVSRIHLDRLCEFLARGRTGARLELPGGICVVAGRGWARVEPPGVAGSPC